MKPALTELCPCGRVDARNQPLRYTDCCARYIDHFASCPAPDAQSLMRSRYTAFVREDVAYLQATWAPAQRPDPLELDTAVRWLGLQVRDHLVIDSEHAEVEFVARHRDSTGRAQRLHERSRFVRTEGRWYYVDGDQH